jgi:hypothetical protein
MDIILLDSILSLYVHANKIIVAHLLKARTGGRETVFAR